MAISPDTAMSIKNNCVFAAIPFYIQEMAVCFPITKQKEPIIIRFISCDYRLCVNASGSVITVVLNCFTLIIISRLHFGQYSGKFSSTVLSQILILVLLLQLGHNSHSFFFILCFSSDNLPEIPLSAPAPPTLQSWSIRTALRYWQSSDRS